MSFDDPPLVFGDLGVDQLFAVRIERGKRRGLVNAHEPAVADHIGGQNSGQTAFHVRLPLADIHPMTGFAELRLR